jgi:hypothetical protein
MDGIPERVAPAEPRFDDGLTGNHLRVAVQGVGPVADDLWDLHLLDPEATVRDRFGEGIVAPLDPREVEIVISFSVVKDDHHQHHRVPCHSVVS